MILNFSGKGGIDYPRSVHNITLLKQVPFGGGGGAGPFL